MNREKDPMEEIIKEDLLIEAEAIEKKMEDADVEEMSVEVGERIRGKLHAQIDEYEKEHVYKKLSEEDWKALELGKQMLREKETDEAESKVVYRKKRPKMWMTLAAVFVLVMAIGVTGFGGAERIVEMMRVAIGEREMVRIDTEENNYVIENEEEEEAYQELKDVFGVDPVKIIHRPDGMEFVVAEIDEELQTATLRYEYKGYAIHYYISSHYTDSSWGIDVEDEIMDQFYVAHERKGEIEVTAYQVGEEKIERYSSNYVHNGLEYFLIGTMNRADFEKIVKNLIFF